MRKKPLSEQVVVVTGASSGLGRAIARGAGARGAKVVVTARNEEALENCVAEIERAGSKALAVPADCAEQEQVERVVARTVERFGRIDTYVANAIVTVYSEAERLEPDELRRVMDVNFFGSSTASGPRCRTSARAGAPSCTSARRSPTGGSRSRRPTAPRRRAWCLSRVARVELQKEGSGVAVSLVLPGAINTPQFDRDRQKIGYQPQPVPPIYQPEPFAEATLRCAERPVRELPIGWGAQKLLWGQKLAPRAGDRILRRTGWKSQHTGEPKPLDAPDNLFDTLPGDPGAHGRFDDRSRGSTVWTRLRLLLPNG